MHALKTRFVQVPLETVKKMLEEQLRREATAEEWQEGSRKSAAEAELRRQEPPLAGSSTSSQREL